MLLYTYGITHIWKINFLKKPYLFDSIFVPNAKPPTKNQNQNQTEKIQNHSKSVKKNVYSPCESEGPRRYSATNKTKQLIGRHVWDSETWQIQN